MGTHKHHIIPRHMGGTDHQSNLIELTIEDHADAHRILYETHGHWQDFIAWKALSGQINSDEIRRLITKLVWTGRKHTPETIQKIKDARSKQKNVRQKGWIPSEITKQRMSEARIGIKLSEETKLRIGDALRGKNKEIIQCLHCGIQGGVPAMKRWHFDNCKENK